jgi:hypothetical protein
MPVFFRLENNWTLTCSAHGVNWLLTALKVFAASLRVSLSDFVSRM